ncbi:hypothetical protein GTQ34_16500 [Muricauda sp. JGD-17]|uniref:TonB C-terminal domain-containing protein n=1 Tax=Flagellimonas ochracea TaxID=2696472 RepID=A0A964TFE5_9FLAO|nr:energy transducer TonB [Allomuricauda ochracea]NAY93509.1 hypothetical protein [Allomuricauda ochracea]
MNERELMGKWETIGVEMPNSDETPNRDAVKLIQDAFYGSKFHFRGNKVFNIQFGKFGDERMKELSFLDNKNWKLEDGQIKIGTESDGYSLMQILIQKITGKTYFILPMIRLEMKKEKDEGPSEPKGIESNLEKKESGEVGDLKLIHKDIDESSIVEFKDSAYPPLGPDCKSKWSLEKRKICTNKFIQGHFRRTFNPKFANQSGISGKVKTTLEFIIDSGGQIVNIKANGDFPELNQEAIRAISSMPKLLPGTKEGKPINVLYKFPLTLTLAE